MTITVTIKVDANPPGTAVRVERVVRAALGGETVTLLARIGGGQSHTSYIHEGMDIRLVEYDANVIHGAAEPLPAAHRSTDD